MLFNRRRLLLTLLDAFGQKVSSTDFQKLLFLYTMEHEETPSYEFVPYRFGAFSFTSYADKRKMIEAGLLVDEDSWTLTEAGQLEARQKPVDQKAVTEFCSHYSALRGDALIAEVYRRYPYYATRSTIVDRVLPNPADRTQIDVARPAQLEPGLLTIGYEGKTLEQYLNQLLKASVTLLCDVRRNPLSRKYGFSKGSLSKACEGVGIRYEHLPELGIASSERGKLETQADYDALFERYEQACLPHQAAALQKIRNWIEHEGYRVALTCYEGQPSMCHRQLVANALERLDSFTLAARHL
ncbi:MAG: DUF488 domain-containing protein [Nitrospirae bacterium]|nr:DUF488 domain-containing protein [Nitrospirota bacterium]